MESLRAMCVGGINIFPRSLEDLPRDKGKIKILCIHTNIIIIIKMSRKQQNCIYITNV